MKVEKLHNLEDIGEKGHNEKRETIMELRGDETQNTLRCLIERELLPLLQEAKGKCRLGCICRFGGGDLRNFLPNGRTLAFSHSLRKPIIRNDVELNRLHLMVLRVVVSNFVGPLINTFLFLSTIYIHEWMKSNSMAQS